VSDYARLKELGGRWKHPFKCPCCDGKGWRYVSEMTALPVTTTGPCNACGGEGVLWR
jgi:DnaJ-class molecular chaperone